MKTIKEADTVVTRMIPRMYYKYSGEYTLSKYSYPCSVKGIYYLVNTLTLEILNLDVAEYNIVIQGHFKEVEKDSFQNYLFKHLFLVNKGIDETREYQKIVKMLDFLSDHSSEINRFTIFPTTACNARCFYCFEKNYLPISLSDVQLDQLIAYMEKVRGNKPLKLVWFGGEPLCGIKQIRYICKVLNEKDVPFDSKMISNGSLFDEKIIKEAIEDWHLKAIQITLDGKEEEYNTRKNYYPTTYSPFFKVLDNIILLEKTSIKISIRLNADLENIDDLKDLVDYLDTVFVDKCHLCLYAFPLFAEQVKDSFPLITQRCLQLNQYIRSLGFASSSPIHFSQFKINYCKAAIKDNVVVGADGNMYACHSIDTKPFGNIKEGITDTTLWEEWKKPKKGKQCCQNCVFLPLCNDYPNCPQSPVYPACKTEMQLKMKYALSNYSQAVSVSFDEGMDEDFD